MPAALGYSVWSTVITVAVGDNTNIFCHYTAILSAGIRSFLEVMAGADLRFYKGGCPIHLKGAPEVERRGGWGLGCGLCLRKWWVLCIRGDIYWHCFFSKKVTLIKRAGVRTPWTPLEPSLYDHVGLRCQCTQVNKFRITNAKTLKVQHVGHCRRKIAFLTMSTCRT